MKKAGRPFDLHIFAMSDHGMTLSLDTEDVGSWTSEADAFLKLKWAYRNNPETIRKNTPICIRLPWKNKSRPDLSPVKGEHTFLTDRILRHSGPGKGTPNRTARRTRYDPKPDIRGKSLWISSPPQPYPANDRRSPDSGTPLPYKRRKYSESDPSGCENRFL